MTQKDGIKEKTNIETKKAIAFLEIFLMISASFAVAVLLSNNLVSAEEKSNTGEVKLSTIPLGAGSARASSATNIVQFSTPTSIEIGAYTHKVTGYSFGTNIDGQRVVKVYSDISPDGVILNPEQTSQFIDVTKNIKTGDIPQLGKNPFKTVYGGYLGGGYIGALVAGVAWAATAYMAVKLIGSFIGLKKGAQEALENAVLAGGFVSGTMKGLINNQVGVFKGLNPNWAYGSGLVVAAVVFILTYKDTKTKTVTFSCMPYEPPIGGQKCEQCNKDPFRPCSEYRCKSLGQACQLLNAGTGNEKCAWVNPKDVNSPVIQTLQSALTTGFKYTPDNAIRPPNRGVKIESTTQTTGCAKAFTPLQFGISLNEPAQCKIDYTRSNATGKAGFDAMQYYFGGSNYYEYNHTQTMRLPSPSSFANMSSPLLKNGDTMTLYVKCMDANGNVNEDDFVFSFCVDKGPDTTPPIVEGTSISDNGYVQYNVDSVPIEVYTNEPAQCRWSRIDKDYKDMENSMACTDSVDDINADLTYTCSASLTAIKNSEANNFYFRCKDYPDNAGAGNNEMQQSYKLTLMGSQPLSIATVSPNGTIRGNTEITPVAIQVKTDSGAEEGKAICYYSETGTTDSYIQMYETNNYLSIQTLDLTGSADGTSYKYYIRCLDAGGNSDDAETSFTLFVDKDAPIVTRAYKESPDALKIVTNEDSTCGYSLTSCIFNINESQKMINVNDATNVHAAEWKNNAFYYIKCWDDYGNNPGNSCSIIVSAVELNTEG